MRGLVLFLCLFLSGCKFIDDIAFKAFYPYARVNVKHQVGEPPIGFEEFHIGDIHCWGKPPSAVDAPIIVYAHGNGENLEALKKGHLLAALGGYGGVIACDYPSYGLSLGPVNQKNYTLSMAMAIELASRISPNVYVIGRSLGAAVAIQSTWIMQQKVKGLIAISGFTSGKAAAKGLSFFGRLISSDFWELHEWNSLETIGEIKIPVFFIHGKDDRVISYKESRKLADRVGGKVLELDDLGHNDIFISPLLWQGIRNFIAETQDTGNDNSF